MDIIQTAFRDRRLPVECVWKMAVLLPKENIEFQGIGIVEVIWKSVLGVVNRWIGETVNFHDALHSF